MKKIAVFGYDLKFAQGIFDVIAKEYAYEVKYDVWKDHVTHNGNETKALIDWADILFCEWALGNVLYCQKHKRKNQKLFVRAHRFEMTKSYHLQYDYCKIDQIFTVSPFVYEEFCSRTSFDRNTLKLLYNAIDIQRFKRDKRHDAFFNIALVGLVPQLKRLDIALDLFEKIFTYDSRYKFFIKGMRPEEFGGLWHNKEQRKFYQSCYDRIATQPFGDHVFFEGWGDIAEFYEKIGFVVSTSDYESFHLAPLEGSASGAIPMVLDSRSGIRPIFLEETIFSSVGAMAQFVVEKRYDENLIARVQQHITKYDIHTIAKQLITYF